MPTEPGAASRSDEEILAEYLGALDEADEESQESIRRAYRRRYPKLASIFDVCDGPAFRGEIDPKWARELVDRLFGGRYEFLGVLGAGGMGLVLRVFDAKRGLEVAIKMIRPDAEDRWEETRRRFLKEVEAMREVDHPHVMPILESGEVDGQPYFVMPVLRGVTLGQRLLEAGPLPPAEVASLGEQAARGLAAIHQSGLVHRDLKPSNIGIEDAEGKRRARPQFGRAVLMDFGLVKSAARTAGRSSSSSLTRRGSMLGTVRYMAPEQVKDPGLADARSDLFSLGCVLYEAATGRPAFDAPSDHGLLIQIAAETPPLPRSMDPKVPAELSRYIMRLLRKEPAARPNSADAVAADLQRIRRRMGPLFVLRLVLLAVFVAPVRLVAESLRSLVRLTIIVPARLAWRAFKWLLKLTVYSTATAAILLVLASAAVRMNMVPEEALRRIQEAVIALQRPDPALPAEVFSEGTLDLMRVDAYSRDVSGKLVIPLHTWLVDLERGRSRSEGHDVEVGESNSRVWVRAAAVARAGEAPLDLGRCRALLSAEGRQMVTELMMTPTPYYCLETDEGRVAMFRILRVDHLPGPGVGGGPTGPQVRVRIEFKTWRHQPPSPDAPPSVGR